MHSVSMICIRSASKNNFRLNLSKNISKFPIFWQSKNNSKFPIPRYFDSQKNISNFPILWQVFDIRLSLKWDRGIKFERFKLWKLVRICPIWFFFQRKLPHIKNYLLLFRMCVNKHSNSHTHSAKPEKLLVGHTNSYGNRFRKRQ